MMLHNTYQGSMLRTFLYVFPIYAFVKHVTPWRAHFWPQGYNLNQRGRGLLVMLLTKYQVSRTCGLRQKDLFMFS